jgi:hypothetical protein
MPPCAPTASTGVTSRRGAGKKALPLSPAAPDTVAFYLGETAATHRPSTLARRLTSIIHNINKVHRAAGLPALTANLGVGETLKGIRRVHGTEQAGKRRYSPTISAPWSSPSHPG